VKAGRVLTLHDQYFWLVAQCVKYDMLLTPGEQPTLSLCSDRLYVDQKMLTMAAQHYQQPHNVLVKEPFRSPNFPVPQLVDWDARLGAIVQELDHIYLRAAGVRYPQRVPCDEDFTLQSTPTETEKWLNTHMFQRVLFGTYGGHRAVVNTMGDVTADKIALLFSEFSRNDTQSRFEFDHIKRLIPKALYLVDEMLDTKQLYGSVRFNYHPHMLQTFVSNMQSSAGIRPHAAYTQPVGTEDVEVIYGGKKFHQFPYFAARFHSWMEELFNSPDLFDRYKYELDTYCVIRLKNEFKYCWPPEELECEKLVKKCREFFIPNMIQQFLSRLCMIPKQMLERGDTIKIGHKWTHGEAQRLAARMKAFAQGFVWHTGDFDKLDKTIRDWMLSLYVMSGSRYFYAQSKKDEEFMKRCFLVLAEKINVKLVNHIHGLWTLMKGIMYSGGYETSHGDSWIVLLVWCLYLVDMITSLPEGPEIAQSLALRLILMIVYGDDHVWVTPKRLSHLINEHKWAEWLKRYTGMSIRDAKVTERFFSTVDGCGEIKDEGVVFLKRYFVLVPNKDRNFPSVMPFKPTHDTILKLLTNKDNDPRIYPLQAIGQAYDTLGTNPISYVMVRRFYDYWMRILDFTPMDFAQVLASMHKSSLNKLKKKIGVDFRMGMPEFPTLECLYELHRIDPQRGTNKIPLSAVQCFYDGNFEDMSFE